jgi:gamma-glutamyltranspeptidase/glutathione hydrolase
VPGAIAMLHMAQGQHGKLAWRDLFGDAERLARDGFPMPARMAAAGSSNAGAAQTPDSRAYFRSADGSKPVAGQLWKNPAYAVTIAKVAAQGPDAILKGPVAEAIVAKLHEGPRPGSMTLADLASYQPHAAPALCRPYRVYVVCTPNAPSGGPAVQEGLGLLERTKIAANGPKTAEGWSLFAQASRLMYADRDRYMGDPAFVAVPVDGLLDAGYLDTRAKLIGDVAGPAPKPGNPRGAGVRGADRTVEPGGTTHFVIVDAKGDVVSMTTTVESTFGSGRMVAGFYLNNQLTDFSLSPKDADGAPAANAVAPGKRPRSSMAPAIILDRQGRFVAAVGSPGGPSILAYNLKALVALMDWKLPMQQALALPNLIARGDSYGAEVDKFDPAVVQGLAQKNIVLKSGGGAEGSGLHGVEVTPKGLRGGADPRREGVAKGY